MRDLGLVFLCKEATLVDDVNTDVNDVIVGDEMLGKAGKHSSLEQALDKEFDPL
jgi:hypothetical protein